jgi:HPt (histidine-containing phosphotransfer) domain-containing protein
MEMKMPGVFVLDKASILERLGGDEEIYKMMVDMFLQDVENNCLTLAAALSGGDAPTLQREIHTVKGLLATFSDEAGAAEAYQAEHKVRNGDLLGVDKAVQGMQVRLREVASVLRAGR